MAMHIPKAPGFMSMLKDGARGLSVAQVTEGYEMARTKALEILDELVVSSLSDLRDHESVKKVIKTSIMSKQIELAEFLSELITKACSMCVFPHIFFLVSILPQKTHFNVDNVRVLKIL
ncbi:T-complex protein 1 subunit theta, partial [Paragonimus westermani]